MIKPNDLAPDFTLPSDGREEVTLSALRPSPVVVFFYPRDDTPGCTIETIDFTSLNEEFAALGAQVFGLSKDSIASHAKFRTKHELRVALLSDAEGQTCEDYGVWGERTHFGKKYMGIERTTVLIDGAGQVARVWNKVKVEGHAREVLEAVRAL